MTENKQKLIALVSALEEESIIDYLYIFIGFKVYGQARLPEGITAELRQMNKQRDRFREEYSEDLKRKIRIAVDSIGGYTREEMFTLEFVYGAVKKYIPENGKAGHEETQERKAEVIRIVSELESLDTIESIYSFIMGMLSMGKGGETA